MSDITDSVTPSTPAAPKKAPKPGTPQAARAAAQERAALRAGSDGSVTLVVRHGTYVGNGCPDPAARDEEHAGFEYNHDHPAQVGERVTKLSVRDAKRMLASKCFETEAQFEARHGELGDD